MISDAPWVTRKSIGRVCYGIDAPDDDGAPARDS